MATTCALLLPLLIFFYLPTPAVSLSFNYYTFGKAYQKDIKIEGDAYFGGDASTESGWINMSANMYGSICRASYNAQPVQLWDKATGGVARFTTQFSFDFDSYSSSSMGGLAFFLTGYPSSLPADSPAYNLGLTNQSADAVASGDSRFVAVEFDTFNNTIVFDPDARYGHIGIDVNSLRSVNNQTLPSSNFFHFRTSAVVDYDNVSNVLAVTLLVGYGPNQQRYNLSSKVDLKSALPEQVSMGFSASTSGYMNITLNSWYFNSSLELPRSPSGPRSGVIAGAAVGAAMFLVLLLAAATALRRRRRQIMEMEEEYYTDSEGEDELMTEIEMGTGPRRFPYHELVEATRNFAAEEKLGQGGFGAVYRGYVRGLAVAIKRFSNSKHEESSMHGKSEYKSEIKVISQPSTTSRANFNATVVNSAEQWYTIYSQQRN